MARSSADKLPSVRVVERRPSGDVYRLTCVSLWCWAASASVSGSGVFNPKNWFLNRVIFRMECESILILRHQGAEDKHGTAYGDSPTRQCLQHVSCWIWSRWIMTDRDSSVTHLIQMFLTDWHTETNEAEPQKQSVSGRSPVGRQSDGGSSHCPHLRLF